MRPTSLLWRSLAAFALCGLFAGCPRGPSPVSVREKTELNGPLDLVKDAKPDPRWRAIQLRTFQINHMWAGAGYTGGTGAPYRVKVTLWDYAGDSSAVAEIYFYDQALPVPANPNPKEAKRPYQLSFPSTLLGAILSTLRNANDPVYLYYYEDQWAVGISQPELVGID